MKEKYSESVSTTFNFSIAIYYRVKYQKLILIKFDYSEHNQHKIKLC